MTMLRVRFAHLLQRWRRTLGRLGRRAHPAIEPQPGHWRRGEYQEPTQRRLLFAHRPRRLRYRLYLPRDRSTPAKLPLLVLLHGCQQDADAFAAGTRMNALADEYRCAVLYPEQSTAANGMRCWNWFDADVQQGRGESALVAGTVREVMQRESLDPHRVYVAGMSAGASMAEVLALRWPRLFAACGMHSGVPFGAATSAGEALGVMRTGTGPPTGVTVQALAAATGQHTLQVPVIVIQGSADATVNPHNADQVVALHLAAAGLWDGSDASPLPTDEQRFEAGGRSVVQRDYATGATLLVRSLSIDGLGHAWSGGDAGQPFNDAAGPDASRLMVDFLMRHRR
jgi:poly(hydroxyalkanoate) depolymerase family esterase